MTDEMKRAARWLVLHGKDTEIGWYDDGTPESGPSGGSCRFFRLGRIGLEQSYNHSCWILSFPGPVHPEMGRMYHSEIVPNALFAEWEKERRELSA